MERIRERWPWVGQLERPIRFGIVGASGVIINNAVLWPMVNLLHVALLPSSALATETAIIWNFLLNDSWTFRNAMQERPWPQRLLRFNGVSLGGLIITAALLWLLTSQAHLPLLLANTLAICGALSWNYTINSRWTWRNTPRTSEPPQSDPGSQIDDRLSA